MLGVSTKEELQEHLAKCRGVLQEVYRNGWPDDPLDDFDLSQIGTRK